MDKCGHGEYLSYRMSTNCAMLILVVTVYCESAIVTVVKEVLPKTVHRICLFHFVQANYRYITENCGLTIPYRDELDIQSVVVTRMGPAPDDYASRKRGGACGRSPS